MSSPEDKLTILEHRLENGKTLSELRISVDAQVRHIKDVTSKLIEPVNSRVEKLEARQLQRGDKGDKGDKGHSGVNGKMGVDGRDGRIGKDGKDGTPAIDGKDGVSIVDAEIALDDHLVLRLSDGSEIDVGEMPSTGAGNNYLIQSGETGTVQGIEATFLLMGA